MKHAQEMSFFRWSQSASHPADLSFWNSAKASIEMQVFSARQQLIDGIKLWAVAHVLVDVQYVGQNTDNVEEKLLSQQY